MRQRVKQQVEFFETYAALLATGTFLRRPCNAAQEEFCGSLRRLAAVLGSKNRKAEEDETFWRNGEQIVNLIEIENETEKMREKGEAFMASLRHDYLEALTLYRELQVTFLASLPNEANAFIRSLLEQSSEKTAVKLVLTAWLFTTLGNMYANEERFPSRLLRVASALEGSGYVYETLSFDDWQSTGSEAGYLVYADEMWCEGSYFESREPSLGVGIADAGDIKSAVSAFCEANDDYFASSSSVSLLLLCGPAGSGKTFLCNEIQSLARLTAAHGKRGAIFLHVDSRYHDAHQVLEVVRPSLQLDLLHSSIGEIEDSILALFARALSLEGKTIALLDDLEFIVGDNESMPSTSGGSGDEFESHVLARSRSTLFSILDSLPTWAQSKLLIICTAKSDISDRIGRFDRVFILEHPTTEERKDLIASSTGRKQVDGSLVDCAIGRSFAELVDLCGQAVTAWHYYSSYKEHVDQSLDDGTTVLKIMKTCLETAPPASLRLQNFSDMVSLQVVTAKELLSNTNQLFGRDMDLAKEELKALIIHPLCHSTALAEILNFGRSEQGRRQGCTGLLLTGPPGCGKSSLAFHCASNVAKQLPSIKLLDVSCTSLIQKEVGSSERNIHRLFEIARSAAPCIVLLDGIENVAAVRGHDNTTEGTMDRVLSTLLTELDGLEERDPLTSSTKGCGIAVIGITHDASWIDPALLRPGRLEKVVILGKLEDEARAEIAENEFYKSDCAGMHSMDAHVVAKVVEATRDMTAAQVKSFCNQIKMTRNQLNFDAGYSKK